MYFLGRIRKSEKKTMKSWIGIYALIYSSNNSNKFCFEKVRRKISNKNLTWKFFGSKNFGKFELIFNQNDKSEAPAGFCTKFGHVEKNHHQKCSACCLLTNEISSTQISGKWSQKLKQNLPILPLLLLRVRAAETRPGWWFGSKWTIKLLQLLY